MFTLLVSNLMLFAEGEGGGGFGDYTMLLPLLAIGALFYFMMIRPEQQRRKKREGMLQELKKNDKIVTIGGIVGTIVNIQKEKGRVTIKVDEGNNVKMNVMLSAIARQDDENGESGKSESVS